MWIKLYVMCINIFWNTSIHGTMYLPVVQWQMGFCLNNASVYTVLLLNIVHKFQLNFFIHFSSGLNGLKTLTMLFRHIFHVYPCISKILIQGNSDMIHNLCVGNFHYLWFTTQSLCQMTDCLCFAVMFLSVLYMSGCPGFSRWRGREEPEVCCFFYHPADTSRPRCLQPLPATSAMVH